MFAEWLQLIASTIHWQLSLQRFAALQNTFYLIVKGLKNTPKKSRKADRKAYGQPNCKISVAFLLYALLLFCACVLKKNSLFFYSLLEMAAKILSNLLNIRQKNSPMYSPFSNVVALTVEYCPSLAMNPYKCCSVLKKTLILYLLINVSEVIYHGIWYCMWLSSNYLKFACTLLIKLCIYICEVHIALHNVKRLRLGVW